MPKRIRVLVIGSGGREVALYRTIKKSKMVRRVFVVPGSEGIPARDRRQCSPSDSVRFALREKIDLVVIGPEAPIAAGLGDAFALRNIPAFCPSRQAAQLESSKARCKLICARYGIPTAEYRTARDMSRAKEVIRKLGMPLVLKADGLRDGKGVQIPKNLDEAFYFAQREIRPDLGPLSPFPLIVERKLEGREVSVMALCDGKQAMLLPPVRDYKRIRAGSDEMTGGMGAYSPVPDVDEKLLKKIKKVIIDPLLSAMGKEGTPYHGVLYAGVMVTKDGPMLLEVNCRFGDPEAQTLLARLQSDLVPYLLACTQYGGLSDMAPLRWKKSASVCVYLASDHYPKEGHRLKSITALGRTIGAARARAYREVERVVKSGEQYRVDIAKDV